jgi:hypothetical protein
VGLGDGLHDREPQPAAAAAAGARGIHAVEADRRRREGWLASAIERDLTERERRLLAEATLLLARLAQGDQRRARW